MDAVAVTLACVNTFLSAVLCFIAYKIGVVTGFTKLWNFIIVGFAVGTVGRLIFTFAEPSTSLAGISTEDTALFLILSSRVLLIVGFYMFLKVAEGLGKKRGN
jgi:hypothetical protein